MVRRTSRVDLESRLKAVGEQPSFQVLQNGHLRHCCVKFPNTYVNFWPSTGSWNVQGRGQQKTDLELRLDKLADSNDATVSHHSPESFLNDLWSADSTSGASCPVLISKELVVQPCDTAGATAALVSLGAPQAKLPVLSEDKRYVQKSGDELRHVAASKDFVASNCAHTDQKRVQAITPDAPLCSELVNLICTTVIADVKRTIKESFAWWRGEQRRTMGETYSQFCGERKRACQSSWFSVSAGHNLLPPERLQTMTSDWLGKEGCALEKIHSQWEQREHDCLSSIFNVWSQKFDGNIAQALARMQANLRAEMQRELEAWKVRERQDLLADTDRLSGVSADQQQLLHNQLLSMKQQLRAAVAKCEVTERKSESLRLRAESAEAEVKRLHAASTARAQKRPVFDKRREFLSKRLRLEEHPALGAFHGDLFRKIQSAESAGAISPHKARAMHETRKDGNRAAHSPIGTFGTQIPGHDADLDEEVLTGHGGGSKAFSSSVEDWDLGGYGKAWHCDKYG